MFNSQSTPWPWFFNCRQTEEIEGRGGDDRRGEGVPAGEEREAFMILIKARLWNVTELAGNPTVWPWERHFTSLSL